MYLATSYLVKGQLGQFSVKSYSSALPSNGVCSVSGQGQRNFTQELLRPIFQWCADRIHCAILRFWGGNQSAFKRAQLKNWPQVSSHYQQPSKNKFFSVVRLKPGSKNCGLNSVRNFAFFGKIGRHQKSASGTSFTEPTLHFYTSVPWLACSLWRVEKGLNFEALTSHINVSSVLHAQPPIPPLYSSFIHSFI